MGHVLVLKAADNLGDGIHLTDMGQEFVAQTFALGGSLDQSGNIDEAHGGGNGFPFGFVHIRQSGKAAVGNIDNADVGLNGAERIVGRLSAGLGNGIEQRAFADIGQSHDAYFEICAHLCITFHVQSDSYIVEYPKLHCNTFCLHDGTAYCRRELPSSSNRPPERSATQAVQSLYCSAPPLLWTTAFTDFSKFGRASMT